MKRRKSCHHLSNLSTLCPAPLVTPLNTAKIPISELRRGTGLCHSSQGWPLPVPCAHPHRSSWARTFALCPDSMQGLAVSSDTRAPCRAGYARRKLQPARAAAMAGQGNRCVLLDMTVEMSLSDRAGVTQLPITWCRTEMDRQLSPRGHIRPPRRWGGAAWEESQAAPRGCQGLCRQGCWWEAACSAAVPLHSWPSHPPLLPSAARFYVAHAERCVFFQWRTRKQAGN